MKPKYIIYLLLSIVLGGLIFYRISENKQKEGGGKEKGGDKKPAKVSGIVLKPRVFSDNLSLSGSIDANEQVEIRSEVSGIVESINFDEGTFVTQGQQLFKINDVELRAQLSQAKTKQALASENERRARLLLAKEAISQEEYDVASADFRSAKAQTQLIQAQIAKTSVKAPFSGKIGLRSISKGTYVTPTIIVANLVNTSQVKITFSIPEKYATQMKINTGISFSVAGSKDTFAAKIYAIEPGIEVDTRTLKMRAIANNSDGKLIPGTFASIALPLDKINDAILVPTEALIPVQNGKKVFVSVNGKAKEVMVETGARTDKEVLVLSGLKAGDTLLTSGVMMLKEDSPVKVNLK
ncbi:putative Co/Zn/Cd efflux system membrane fusion protein [Flavobacterium enshiense DK69]|uniref:Cation transporter n=1 Tax=Flavobacterium enshiense DK69 TaxID=1107311 RepID=V6S9H3_9FLAO|nr:efflux RND transporter periplasmic adaptor subunit [Flavobacterium enshiense]ESU23318.1 putative Co/Zn/Cd efflux system membrane fusion protein [Flavobacterium enshiense DK69]KGO96450.1 cation transporter [Flavobacterium enshiense DK69]